MSTEAVIVFRVPYADVCRAHQMAPAADQQAAKEATFPFVPVGADATACFLQLPMAIPPEELAAAARQAIGEPLDRHTDERGVPVFSDAAWPEAGYASYDAAAGAASVFVPKLGAEEVNAMIEAQMREAGLGALAPKLSQMSSRLQGAAAGGTGDLFAAAQEMLASMSPEEQAQLEMMAKQMFGIGDAAPQAPVAKAPAPKAPAPPPAGSKPKIVDDEFGEPED
jgi:hypothetical protein